MPFLEGAVAKSYKLPNPGQKFYNSNTDKNIYGKLSM